VARRRRRGFEGGGAIYAATLEPRSRRHSRSATLSNPRETRGRTGCRSIAQTGPPCGVDRGFTLVGQRMPPRRAGGQPLHPIYTPPQPGEKGHHQDADVVRRRPLPNRTALHSGARSLTTSSLTRTWQASTPEFVNEMDVSPLRVVIEYSENAYRSGSLVTKAYPYRTKVQWR
jgi:hypothetical protein